MADANLAPSPDAKQCPCGAAVIHGFGGHCSKLCYDRAWRAANAERLKIARKAYYEANREKILEQTKAWKEANPEKRQAANKLYYEVNAEKVRATQKACREANPEKVQAAKKEYYETNREKIAEKAKVYYEANVEKACARAKAWRETNPEKKRAAAKAWHEANRDKLLAEKKQYYKINREKAVAAQKAWREANAEKVRAAAKAWQVANPDKRKAHHRNRRAQKLAAEGCHTSDDIDRIRKAQKGKCAYCRRSLKKLGEHIDHIIPLARGGSNWPSNLQLTCPEHNMRKRAKDPVDYARELGMLL